MIVRVVLAAALLVLVFVVGAAARALILAATRHGRHGQREQAADAEASAFVAELRGLPAPGETIYTDHNVWLPRTLAAEPGPAAWTPPAHALEAVSKRYPDGVPAGVAPEGHWLNAPPDSEKFLRGMWGDHYGEPGEPGERLDPDADVAESLCHCGRPAGHLADQLLNGDIDTAFDTSQFPVVIA